MRHFVKINDVDITVDINCTSPDMEDNTCSGCSGDCEHCRYAVAVMSAEDFFKLRPQAQ